MTPAPTFGEDRVCKACKGTGYGPMTARDSVKGVLPICRACAGEGIIKEKKK